MHGLRRKTFFLGPQEFSKYMRNKQILIGLFALIIYRTIGEPKKLQGGRERAFVNTCFLRPATAGTGILGVVFAQPATAGTGANGLRHYKNFYTFDGSYLIPSNFCFVLLLLIVDCLSSLEEKMTSIMLRASFFWSVELSRAFLERSFWAFTLKQCSPTYSNGPINKPEKL